MGKPLRVLIIEDYDDDVELLLHELRREGYELEFELVRTAKAMQMVLTQKTWDLILSDYTLPQFDAPQALEILKASGLDLPFIIVSGTISEEIAVSALKAGANDVIVKGKFSRLGPAIERELREAETRRERKGAEEALLASEVSYRRLFEAAKDGILILNADTGEIVDVNPFLMEMLGYSQTEFLGKQLWEIGFFKDIVANKAAFLKLQEERYIRYENLPLETRDGRLIWVEFVSNAYDVNGKQVIQCNIRDISERKRAEEQVHIQAARLKVLADASQTFAAVVQDYQVMLDVVARQTAEALDAVCGVRLISEDGEWLEMVAMHDVDSEALEYARMLANQPLRADEPNFVQRILQSQQPLLIPGVSEDQLRTVVKPEDWVHLPYIASHSRLLAPIRNRSQALGFLIISRKVGSPVFDEHDLSLAQDLADRAGLAISNARLFKQVQNELVERKRAEEKIEQQNQRLKVLREIDTAILAADSIENIVSAALSHVRELMGCQRANLTLIDWGANESVIFDVSTDNETSIPKGRRFPLAQYQDIIQALSQKQTLLMNDLRALADPRPAIQSLLKDGLQSLCSLPLSSQGNLIGMFSLYSDVPNYFDDEKTNLGREIANQVAIAITQNRLVEGLRESEQKFFLLFEKSSFAISLSRLPDGVIVNINEAFESTFGYTKQEAVGKTSLELGINPDAAGRARMLAALNEHGSARNQELVLHTKLGKARIFSVNVDFVDIGDQKYVLNTALDITERKQAEEKIAYQSRLLENVNDAVFATDTQFNITSWNHAAEEMYGYRAEEVLGHKASEVIRSEFSDAQRAVAVQDLSESGSYRIEVLHYHRDGHSFWIEGSTFALKELNEQVYGYISINRDITQRKQAEERLIQSEIRYRRLFESAKDGILILDAETGTIADVNPFLITLLGYSEEDLLGKNIWGLGFFRDILANKANFLELHQKEYIRYEDLPLETADGRRISVEFVSNVYEVDQKKVIQCNIRDITERKRAEEQIKRQLKHLNALRMIDTAINSSFDLDVILEVVLQQVLAELVVDASAILLFNPQLQTIEYAASRGFRADALYHTQLKLGEGYAGRAVLERKTTHISDLMQTGGQLASSLLLEHESFVDYYGTPLIVKGEVKGVLEIYHRSHLKADSEWLEFLEVLAGQAAIAIDNAQLFENLRHSNLNLEVRVIERTAELHQTNTELEDANRVKDEFLANMSHELRTPLTSVLGLSESLLEQRGGSLNEHQRRSLEVIEASGQHLLQLINDILDLSKIEAGKFDYYPQPVSVDDTCRSSLSFIKAQAAKKSITVTYIQDLSISKIFADPRRLKQILVNLLSNAVKFTHEKGEVILQVTTDLEQDLISFAVIDHGIGISQEDLQRLFQPFVQVDSGLNRQHEGTGLGLALVQKLTDLHGGSVQVESEVGKGSRFTINLPCLQEEVAKLEKFEAKPTPPIAEWAKNIEVPAEAPKHLGVILVADDNMPSILTIGEYLESHGYEVVVAHDGTEALKKAEEINPDLILMDIQMPVMNGLEATARLRDNVRFAHTPIIVLTALAMPGDRERSLLAGANEYMSKPVSLKELLRAITNLRKDRSEA
jgi:PAS domain S-box-containing protein